MLIAMYRGLLIAAALLSWACSPTFWGRPPTRWDRTAFERDQAARVLGCAELGFSLDRETSLTSDSSLLLDVSLRNHCVRDTAVNLRDLRITSRDESGAERPVDLYDPRNEIVPYQLDALADGTERLRIDVHGSLNATHVICIDVSRISPDAKQAAPSPVCLYAPSPDPVGAIEQENR